MQTFLTYIDKWVHECPDKPAVICDSEIISYSTLYARMMTHAPLPIPLLGDSWDGDFILYTTGTTGKSKGVIISQEAVLANSENLIAGQGFCFDTFFIIAGNMEHLGCWSKIFPTLIQGGTLFILKDGMKNIDDFFAAFETTHPSFLTHHLKFATFLVPANIRILLQIAAERLGALADRMDFLETGAAPMPQTDMDRLCQLLPHSRLYNTYASTETGICATYDFNGGDCVAGCVGRPLPHSRIFITHDGKIACKGNTLMSGYKDDEILTERVLHDGTLFTSDNGYLDEEGRLHVLGRNDDIINTGGYKVAPAEVEEVAMAHPDIKDCICIPVPHPILGKAPALLIVLKEGVTLNKRSIALFVSTHLDRYKVPVSYKTVDRIKRNQNGKLDRKFYCR